MIAVNKIKVQDKSWTPDQNMNKININWRCLVVITFLAITVENTLANPDSSAVSALLDNAETNYYNQQFEQAVALFERALRIEPNNPKIWYHLAKVRLAQKDWKRAIPLAQKSNALAGSDNNLRKKNRKVITQAFEQAAGELDRALQKVPNNPELWYQLAEIRLTQAQVLVDAPLEYWKRVLILADKSNRLADKDLQKKNKKVIIQALERALYIAPHNSEFLHHLAELRLEQKQWAEAFKLANQSLNYVVGNDELRLNNWVVITQACEAMDNWKCVQNARNQAQSLAQMLAE